MSSLPLSSLLLESLPVLQGVGGGKSLSTLIPQVPLAARPGVQSLCFFVLRQHLKTEKLLSYLLTKKAPNPRVKHLLKMGLALLGVSDHASGEGVPVYAPFTVVNEVLKAASEHPKTGAFKGLLNACLRRYLREKAHFDAQVASDDSARYNLPAWWLKRLQADYPQLWTEVARSGLNPGPMSLRVNERQGSCTLYQERLSQQGIPVASVLLPSAVTLENAVPVSDLPGFETGACSVQDVGAQCAGWFLKPYLQAGARVLDACSAPGGKAAHLLEQCDIRLWATDLYPERLARVQDTFKRLGFDALSEPPHCVVHNALLPLEAPPFDVVVADVPCTGSGVVRRHPDMVQLRTEKDVEQTADVQAKILKNLWSHLKVGGYLLYVTCSVFSVEGIEQIRAFLAEHQDALPTPLFADQDAVLAFNHHMKAHYWCVDTPENTAKHQPFAVQLCPWTDKNDKLSVHDGFFYALLRKSDPHSDQSPRPSQPYVYLP